MFSYNECSRKLKTVGAHSFFGNFCSYLRFYVWKKIKTDIKNKYWLYNLFSLLRYFLLILSKKIRVIIWNWQNYSIIIIYHLGEENWKSWRKVLKEGCFPFCFCIFCSARQRCKFKWSPMQEHSNKMHWLPTCVKLTRVLSVLKQIDCKG